jgi:DNA-binding NtrC family response regulator
LATSVQPATSTMPLRVLLVGKQEEDFFLIREMLERARASFSAELEHVHTLDEAKTILKQQTFGLVLFEHDTGNADAVRLLAEFLHAGVSLPFILLTEHADEKTVAASIESGTWNCVAKSHLDGATLVRTIRGTLALHSMQRDQITAEQCEPGVRRAHRI